MAHELDRGSGCQRGEPSTSDRGTAAEEDQLARQLSELARDLQEKQSLQDTLNGIAQAAVDNVPGRERD